MHIAKHLGRWCYCCFLLSFNRETGQTGGNTVFFLVGPVKSDLNPSWKLRSETFSLRWTWISAPWLTSAESPRPSFLHVHHWGGRGGSRSLAKGRVTRSWGDTRLHSVRLRSSNVPVEDLCTRLDVSPACQGWITAKENGKKHKNNETWLIRTGMKCLTRSLGVRQVSKCRAF